MTHQSGADIIATIEQCDARPWTPATAEHRASAMAALTRLAVTESGRPSDPVKMADQAKAAEIAASAAPVPPPGPPPVVLPPLVGTFKERNRPLSELIRELMVLRPHNLKFKDGDSHATLLMLAEAAIVCMTMECFVRAVVSDEFHPQPMPRMELFNLLDYAVSRKLINVPFHDQADGVRRLCNVRNSLLHGNFDQAAKASGSTSVEHYFQTQFASEVEVMTKITNDMLGQISVETGRPHWGPASSGS